MGEQNEKKKKISKGRKLNKIKNIAKIIITLSGKVAYFLKLMEQNNEEDLTTDDVDDGGESINQNSSKTCTCHRVWKLQLFRFDESNSSFYTSTPSSINQSIKFMVSIQIQSINQSQT